MTGSELLLQISRLLVFVGLAVFIGGTLIVLVAEHRGERTASSNEESGRRAGVGPEPLRRDRALTPLSKKTVSSPVISDAVDRAKFIASGGLLVGVLLQVQVLGSALPPRHLVRDGLLFLLVAVHVYSVMAVAPRIRYYREKTNEAGEGARAAWQVRLSGAQGRVRALAFAGLLLSLAALAAS